MSKKLFLMLTLVLTIVFIGCNKDEDTVILQSNPVIGTWKLVEEYSNNQLVTLNNCNLQETYIFGEQQFTHEMYSNGGRFDDSTFQKGGDDDDDDDHSGGSNDDDDDDDDHGPVNPNPGNGGGTTDDDDDDDHGGNGGTGTCVLSETVIGYWTNPGNNLYSLTSSNAIDTKNIIFTDNGNKFYYETAVNVNGISVTKKYVFKRQ
ncbi:MULTISPECIES: lipocalin family protein [Flavobacterium]|uniref:Lipocalin-like domain-containing protein n=1 Tax=Flavobacterium supellecticarium TaxID=2565924 RepID=A0A4S3ZPN9_9FLAO|nr:lipocalin family protein [Flavobacterium supellecticarium]THF47463.1 hypothetical protein E6C50_17035 [Flavobacterium supellecticarium]